jgi:hypothetical protein
MKMEGFREMERNLAKLKRGTAKGVTRRALKRVLKPVAHAAAASPFEIAITSRLTQRQRRGARFDFGRDVVSMYVGPVDDFGDGAPHAHLIEFGTGPRFHSSGKYVGAVMADPFMRPAWDAHKATMTKRLGEEIWAEIERAMARAARRAGGG